MTEWNDRVIVLRLGLFHESDVWLRALSKDRGLITLFAFGGAKSLRRFCGCLDKLNTLQCRIKAGRSGYLTLQEAELMQGPGKLRSDWRGMGIADNCINFMEAVRIGSDSSGEAFPLLEGLRELLAGSQGSRRLTTFFFRLRLASMLGFAPDFEKCASCGSSSERDYIFIPEDGRVFCSHCALDLDGGQKRRGLRASHAVLARLSGARFSPPSEWREDDLTESGKRACSRLIDCFIRYHLGIGWEKGAFRHV